MKNWMNGGMTEFDVFEMFLQFKKKTQNKRHNTLKNELILVHLFSLTWIESCEIVTRSKGFGRRLPIRESQHGNWWWTAILEILKEAIGNRIRVAPFFPAPCQPALRKDPSFRHPRKLRAQRRDLPEDDDRTSGQSTWFILRRLLFPCFLVSKCDISLNPRCTATGMALACHCSTVACVWH